MSFGWLVVIGIVALLLVVRVSGYLTREIAREGMKWCGVCGIEIVEGWVLVEVKPSPDDPAGPARRTPAYFCRRHRPADARAAPWHA